MGSCRRRYEFWFPTQPDPLLQVIGQASPKNFTTHLDQTPNAEATQPQLFLDPEVRKFSNLFTLAVNSLRFRRFHLLHKGVHQRVILGAYNRPSLRGFARSRTALCLKRTAAASRALGSIEMTLHSGPIVLHSPMR